VTLTNGAADLLAALAIAVGLAGIIVPVLPGSLLILAALLLWAVIIAETTGWVVFAVATTFVVVGQVVKYVLPGRRMRTVGVPNSTLAVGTVGAIVGFFVIPVVGFVVGFVLGVYVAELRRVGRAAAGGSTWHALKAVGLSVLIELAAALLAAATFAVGVVAT
jgi:uncharacterized protein YqgC (DUF456 family)